MIMRIILFCVILEFFFLGGGKCWVTLGGAQGLILALSFEIAGVGVIGMPGIQPPFFLVLA